MLGVTYICLSSKKQNLRNQAQKAKMEGGLRRGTLLRTPVRVTPQGASLEAASGTAVGRGPCLSATSAPPAVISASHTHQKPERPLPSQARTLSRKAHTQDTFPPAKHMVIKSISCSEFPRVSTLSHVPALSVTSTSFHLITKRLIPALRRREGRNGQSPSIT